METDSEIQIEAMKEQIEGVRGLPWLRNGVTVALFPDALCSEDAAGMTEGRIL